MRRVQSTQLRDVAVRVYESMETWSSQHQSSEAELRSAWNGAGNTETVFIWPFAWPLTVLVTPPQDVENCAIEKLRLVGRGWCARPGILARCMARWRCIS